MAITKPNRTVAKTMAAVNRGVYKLTNGRLFGSAKGAPIRLLTTTGRKSGKERTQPLILPEEGAGWVAIASFGGHDHHPDWFLNLEADPTAVVTDGGDEIAVRARVAEGEERARLWEMMAGFWSDYDEYQKVTDREIPVVVLDRV